MSYWNYRVTRDTSQLPQYGIREVYYREKDDAIAAWTSSPFDLVGETPEDIKDDIELVLLAFNLPVIDITDEDNPYEVTE